MKESNNITKVVCALILIFMLLILVVVSEDHAHLNIACYLHFLDIGKRLLLDLMFYAIIILIILGLIMVLYPSLQSRISSEENEFKDGINCILIEGEWGSGKTTYYEDEFKPKLNKPIYISCFSANSEKLITMIITKNMIWNILSLWGILSKFFINNWQLFMPYKQYIVFDDLERLHCDKENYLDLIGIVDFLKNQRECKIILIANISKTQPILNEYMERIVDEVKQPPVVDLYDVLDAKNDINSPIYRKCINRVQKIYKLGMVNLRILKTIYKQVKK